MQLNAPLDSSSGRPAPLCVTCPAAVDQQAAPQCVAVIPVCRHGQEAFRALAPMGAFQCRLALASACLCVFTLLRSLRHCCERSRARLARPPLPNCSAPSCAPSGPKASRAAHHKQFEVTLPSALSPCACQGHSARSVDWVAPGGSEVERRASTANARKRFPSPPPTPPPPAPGSQPEMDAEEGDQGLFS